MDAFCSEGRDFVENLNGFPAVSSLFNASGQLSSLNRMREQHIPSSRNTLPAMHRT